MGAIDKAKLVAEHQLYMEEVFRQQGDFRMMGVVFVTRLPGGSIKTVLEEPVALPILANDSEHLAAAMRHLAMVCRGVAAIVMSEAWVSPVAPGTSAESLHRGYAEKSPERTEALMLAVEVNGERELWSAKITRSGGEVTIGTWIPMEARAATGTLVGLLPQLN